jgi:hypothetical protein
MPGTLLLDTVDGSEFDIQVGSPNVSRGGLVTGISGDPSTAIDQVIAAAGLPLGQAGTINGQSAFLQRVTGRAASSDTFRVQLMFGNAGSFTPSAYVITDRSYTQAYQSNRIPGTRKRLLVPRWRQNADDPHEDDPSNPSVPADLAMMTWQYPMREIIVSGLKYGSPPDDSVYAGKIGKANAEQFLGLPRGYWHINSASTNDSKYSGYYSYQGSAVSKVVEDWSHVFTLYSSLVNKYVDIDPAVEQRVLGAAYKYEVIDSGPGILRVGPFDLTSFAAIFGFTSSSGGGAPFLNKYQPPAGSQG